MRSFAESELFEAIESVLSTIIREPTSDEVIQMIESLANEVETDGAADVRKHQAANEQTLGPWDPLRLKWSPLRMRSFAESELFEAIESVLSTIIREPTSDEVVQTIESLANEVETDGAADVRKHQAAIEQSLGPWDPLRLKWSPLRMLGRESDEPSWTQWLANLLRLEADDPPDDWVAWPALCQCVLQAMESTHGFESDDDDLAGLNDWENAKSLRPEVANEVPFENLGTVDLLIQTDTMVIALENKLDSGWSDWAPRKIAGGLIKQTDRYRELAIRSRRNKKLPKYALVAMSCKEGVPAADDPKDYLYVQWSEYGRELRKALISRLGIKPLTPSLLPLVATVAAIEQDLMGLRLVSKENPTWRDWQDAIKINRHLRRGKGHNE